MIERRGNGIWNHWNQIVGRIWLGRRIFDYEKGNGKENKLGELHCIDKNINVIVLTFRSGHRFVQKRGDVI